jgi:hypothetical protein
MDTVLTAPDVIAEPLRPDVEIHLATAPSDNLALTAHVVAALERAGYGATANAFASIAQEDCQTTDDLMLAIRCTVTVL